MKNFLFQVIAIVFASIPIICEGQIWSDTMHIDTIYNSEGKITELINWDNLESASYTYYKSGNVKREMFSTRKEGRQFDIVKEYDPSTSLKYEYSCFVLDRFFYGAVRLDGDYIEYFGNGNVKSISHYEMNRLNGLSSGYYKNGQIENRVEYHDNRIWNVESYDSSGNILDIGDFKNGSGRLRIYVKGIQITTCLYKNGKRVRRSCKC